MRLIDFFGAALVTVVFSGTFAVAAEPAFDCAKAESSAEKLICSHDELAELDQKLASVYEQAVDAVETYANKSDALSELRAFQRGWVKGRDECWKADDELACIRAEYEYRIAEITARYSLIKGQAPVFYTCNDNPADEIVATFYPTTPPSARLERGDTTEIAVEGPTGSGARYLGSFGIVFWIKGNDAMVEWPQGTSFDCKVRS
ncbi:MliC family protein [uncultured Roseibium sp.]|uniref:MliC family protein n=1 Tax=uncultured Roseibium sp. TaxID=1936171 RepID=UPI00261A3E8D|nr:MliC family protein [uncultured Roseibium sp.]